jgi:hypothetical protein
VLLRSERRRSPVDYKVVGAYLAGTTCGAGLTAVVAWLLSGFAAPLPPPARAALVALGAIFVWLVKEGPLGRYVALPEAHRQIPSDVFRNGPLRGAYRFGLELGTGVRTYAPSPAVYVLLLAVLLGHLTLAAALMVAAGFGLGRALPLMVQLSLPRRWQITSHFLACGTRFAPNVATALVLAGALRLV